jgi:hypothetical protein
LEKEIENIDTTISSTTDAINNLKKDKKVIVSKLYNSNKNSINKIEDYSNITTFIKHLYKIRRTYYIDFK